MINILIPYFVAGGFLGTGLLMFFPFLRSGTVSKFSSPWLYGMGLVAVCYVLFLFNLAGGAIFRIPVLIGLVLMWGGAFLTGSFMKCSSFQPVKISFLFIFSMVPLLLALLTSWIQSVTLPLYHLDSVINLGMKAKILFHEGTFYSPHFMDPKALSSASFYPLLVPYMQAIHFWVAGSVQDDSVKQAHFILWIFLLILVFQRIKSRLPRGMAWFLLLIFATLPAWFADDETQVASGVSDLPFAFFWTGTVLAALYFLEHRESHWIWGMAIMSLGCAFTKPNGVALSGLAWGILFLASRKKVVLAGGFVTLVLSLPIFGMSNIVSEDPIFGTLFSINFSQGFTLDRMGGLVKNLAELTLKPAFWGIFWPSVFLLTLIKFKWTPAVRFLFWILGAQVILYVLFILNAQLNVDLYAIAVWPRWLLHMAPLAVLLAAECWTKESRTLHPPESTYRN